MQKSLTGIIADRYRQQSFDILTSKDDLKPSDIRRLCLDYIRTASESHIRCDGNAVTLVCRRRA